MPDNISVTAGSGTNVVADEVTYSGDTAKLQGVELFVVTGAEGSRVAVHLPADATDGLLVNLGANNDVTVTGVSTAALQGALTETAPATDTASSGLNGRLQRIAQRLTSLIALLPAALGAGGGLKVDGSGTALPVSGTVTANAGTGTMTVSGTVTANAGTGTQAVSLATVPSHAVTNAGTFAVQSAEADGANVTLGAKADAKSTATDATAITAMQVWKQISASVQAIATSVAGSLTVATHAVTQSGTWTVQPGNTANTTAWKVDGSAVTQPISGTLTATGALDVDGQAAHDAAISGDPVRIGARAMSADVTAVGSGDAVDIVASLLGKQVNLPYALPGLSWSYPAAAGGLVNTTGVSAKAAAGAGIRIYVTSAQVINSHATISTEVMIRDGAAGTVLHRGWAQAAGGGYAAKFDPPLRGTANTLLEIAEVTATGTTGVVVNLQGFTAAE